MAAWIVLGLALLLHAVGLSSAEPHTPMTIADDRPDHSGTVDVEPGELYRSGARVGMAAGASFLIPPDWQGFMPPGSRTFYLESPTKPGIGLIAIIRDATPQELEDHLNEPQVIEEGYVLHPVGSATRTDTRITASYHSGEHAGRALAFFGPLESGVLYLFTGPREETPYYESLLEQLAASTRFTDLRPNTPDGRDGT